MTDEPKNDPRNRMRALLGEGQDRKMPERKPSPLTRLPKKAEAASFVPDEKQTPPVPVPPASQVESLDQTQGQPASVSPPRSRKPSNGRRYNFGPPFWTITGFLSLVVNAILIGVLWGLLTNIRTLQLDSAMTLPQGLVSGLYSNFEKMDRAHIRTSIDVGTTIPVTFDLQLNQQTNVVLSQDVRIDNARVTVNTGGLNITNALTTIVLPAGTSLPIVLNLSIPVDQSVPVALTVPVDIALKDTDLHEPFVGLQQVIQPLYCMVTPGAVNLDGQPICVTQ